MDQRARTQMLVNNENALHHPKKKHHPPHGPPKPGTRHQETTTEITKKALKSDAAAHGLCSDDSFKNRGLGANAKISPGLGEVDDDLEVGGSLVDTPISSNNVPMSPYEIHDGHNAKEKQNEKNADGSYFINGGKSPKVPRSPFNIFKRGNSSGFFVGEMTQNEQEKEMCWQIGVASFFICVFFGVIIGMLMPLLKDLTVGGQGFFILIGMLVIVAMACKHFSDKGYNICEIAGGRPGGASG